MREAALTGQARAYYELMSEAERVELRRIRTRLEHDRRRMASPRTPYRVCSTFHNGTTVTTSIDWGETSAFDAPNNAGTMRSR